MTKPLKATKKPSIVQFPTHEVLDRIRDVIKNTVTPAWLNPVPSNFGYAAAGTLKAAEWRTLAAVYLPIALVTLWGEGSNHPSHKVASNLRQVLDNTMALFSAAQLACMRKLTNEDIDAYHEQITRYVKDFQVLYPSIKCRPNHHMAQHIPKFLRSFGPVQSWWCFPFERLIGVLQRLPSNNKLGRYPITVPDSGNNSNDIGEREATVHHSFIRTSRLKAWLSRPGHKPAIQRCRALFDKLLSNLVSLDSPTEQHDLDQDNDPPHPRTSDRRRHARFKHGEIVYSRASTHFGNSLVEFQADGDQNSTVIQGEIQAIQSIGGKYSFLVRRQLPLHPGTMDPFRHYKHAHIKLCSSRLADKEENVPVEWVIGHFARYPLSPELAVGVSLSR
jgi:hypothetical protein